MYYRVSTFRTQYLADRLAARSTRPFSTELLSVSILKSVTSHHHHHHHQYALPQVDKRNQDTMNVKKNNK